jgi:hypothetical protein
LKLVAQSTSRKAVKTVVSAKSGSAKFENYKFEAIYESAFAHALRRKASTSKRVMRACANGRGGTTSFQIVSQARPLSRDNANDAKTESLHLGRRAMLAALSLAVQATSWHMWPATAEAK